MDAERQPQDETRPPNSFVAQPSIAQPSVAQPSVAQPSVAQPSVAQPWGDRLIPTAAEYNPYAPAQGQLTYAVPKKTFLKSGAYYSLLVLHTASVLTLLIGFGFMFRHIETILVSGPIYLVLGIVILTFGFLMRQLFTILSGSAAAFYAIGVFLTIYLLEWSPGEADQPVKYATAIFGLNSLPVSVVAIIFARRKHLKTQPKKVDNLDLKSLTSNSTAKTYP